MAVKYFHLGEALYYRILESIVERERMILGDADLSVSVRNLFLSTVMHSVPGSIHVVTRGAFTDSWSFGTSFTQLLLISTGTRAVTSVESGSFFCFPHLFEL